MQGSCLCGAVTLEVAKPKQPELHACHCEMCRKWSGAALLEFDVLGADLTVRGAVQTYASSDIAERAWCPVCGSNLWYKATNLPQEIYALSAGLFPDAGGFALAKEIYIDRKPAGYAFAGAHLKLTEQEHEAQKASFQQGEAP